MIEIIKEGENSYHLFIKDKDVWLTAQEVCLLSGYLFGCVDRMPEQLPNVRAKEAIDDANLNLK